MHRTRKDGRGGRIRGGRVLLAGALAAAACWAAPPGRAAAAPPPAPPDAREIMGRMNRAAYYAGRDMRARITMQIVNREGDSRPRVMTMLRLTLPDDRDQKYLVYFHEPGDVRRMTCMVNKHLAGPDERWIFVPAVNRVRRIEAPERSRFLGSDFVREEFSGRDPDADTHTLLREEKVDGRACWVIESVPKDQVEYAKCVSWIDQKTCLPLRQEFRDGEGKLQRTFTGGGIKEIQGRDGKRHPTLMERKMSAASGDHWTTIALDSVEYDTGLRDSDFSEDHMKVQLSDWLK
jgi:outer membrane lipoprotein-sorting protein